ncbi:MAG: acyltransferase family protein [Micropepsaceae bacterium]
MSTIDLKVRDPAPNLSARDARDLYRPDIDGLRAVAVLSVLFFHAGLPPFSGGFVGVDIFFVISGFLITRIILGDLERGTMSIARFYERRIRRIFPALYVTIAFTVIGATVLFSPVDLARLYESLAWLAVFASNVHFMANTGYFDAAAEQNAFLQTWSLAIEEQFYVVFPLALAFSYRYARSRVLWIVLGVAILSFAFACVAVSLNARTAFFSTPGRVWELMAGSLIALGLLPAVTSQWLRESLAAAGAGALAGSIVLLTIDTPFPGLYALPACLGTAAIIWANSRGVTVVGRLLSVPPMVFVGLVSYSLYLLHWPMLTFARYVLRGDFTLVHALVALALSFVAAVACWRYVETPFRKGKQISQRGLFAGAIALMAVVAASSLAAGHWYVNRLPAADRVAAAERARAEAESCMLKETQTLADWPAVLCSTEGNGLIVVWGDSFAAHYFDSFRDLAKTSGRGLLLLSESGCPPIVGVEDPKRTGCGPFNREVLEKIKAEKPDLVVISADWMVYEKKKTFAEAVVDKFELLERTIDALRATGSAVLVIGPSPMFPAPVPQIAGVEGQQAKSAVTKASYSRRFDEFFRGLERKGQINYLPAFTVFCDVAVYCMYQQRQTLLFWDEGHMTARGSALVLNDLTQRFPHLFGPRP